MRTDEIWKKYQAIDPEARSFEAWSFCFGGEVGDRLADLVLKGIKTATASAHQIYALEGSPLPKEGDLSIILRSDGEAACIIKTTGIKVCKFLEVSPEHAYEEGEGDRTLDYWRRVHREFFSEELAAHNIEFSEEMLVVCEKFKVVLQ
ncbi:MAG: ASCH domain protein [Methanomassiliicoccales archaeon PtaU1.Bin124]|nr:MAG: ASCH domain protein [Methanomassiliicoccales archaeon PtaU1.Bin124]